MSNSKTLTLETILSSPLLVIDQLKTQIGNTLILAPHFDNDLLGFHGLLRHLLDQKVPVYIAFVTSGNASNGKSEAKKSNTILGLEAAQIFVLTQSDSLLDNLSAEVETSIISNLEVLIQKHHIETLCLPWRREPDAYHRATYQLGRRAVKGCAGTVQMMEYPIGLRKQSLESHWPKIDEVEVFRLDVQHLSEDIKASGTSDESLQTSLSRYEYFFFDRNKVVTSLDKNYFDTLYAENHDPWNFTGSEYENSKYEKVNFYLDRFHYKKALELGCSIGIQTQFLSKHCEELLAVDISQSAIDSAREINPELSGVQFEQMDILNDFPDQAFDLITMCELGYYFSTPDLLKLFGNINEHLNQNGHFLMVHWTSFVRDYPLSGRQVHLAFKEFMNTKHRYECVSIFFNESYELVLWKKL